MTRSIGVVLGCCISTVTSAFAQTASIINFDPIPNAVQMDAAQRADFAEKIRVFLAADMLGPAKIWRKSHGDGFIVCAVMPPQKGRRLQYVAALSISTGPFSEIAVKNIWNEADYNLYGCNTPDGLALP